MLNYLIIEDFSGQAAPFLFPVKVDHGDMRDQLPYSKIISGGLVELGVNGFICRSVSTELGIVCRPHEDAALIKASLTD